MFETLDYEKFAALAKTHQSVAVYKEIAGDKLTPINACLALQDTAKDLSLLESSPKEKALGRYSYLCFSPVAVISAYGDQVTISHEGKTKTQSADPFAVLEKYQQQLAVGTAHPLSGFVGGLVGFIGYDAIRFIEEIPDRHENVHNIPDILFRSYANNITFDHQTGKVIISTVAEIQDDAKAAYEQALDRIQGIIQQLMSHAHEDEQVLANKHQAAQVQVDTEDADYCHMVEQAKQHIVEGDVFQIVLSRQFSVPVKAKPFDIYRALRFSNPSPYMFYLEAEDYVIAGASPEKLISLKDGVLESCPLAGTRPRSGDQDDAVAEALLQDSKETAEHMMLVDLARNDLGAVANPGSVKVTKLKQIEKHARVMHIASTVQAELRQDKSVFDAIKASFPAGTLSGAPKIRAMQCIDALEHSRRGVYGGAICGINSQGDLDSCIAIRTAVIKGGVATVRAGAGVVFDSDPQAEADETRHKAQAILEGILLAEDTGL